MRKVFTILSLMLTVILITSFQYKKNYSAYLETFNQSGLKLEASNINGWVKQSKVFKDGDDLKSMACSIYSDICGSDESSRNILVESYNRVIIKYNYEMNAITIITGTVYNDVTQKYESIASVDITQQGSLQNINAIREMLYNCLKDYGDEVNVDICMTGYIEGRMNIEDREQFVDNLFLGLKAQKIEGIHNESLISVSGFSSSLPYSIKCNNNDININIACRYSSLNDKTYFWLGTPVINMEY